MDYKKIIIDELKTIPRELQNHMIEERDCELDDAFIQGSQICMLKTLDLLMDTKIKDDVLIRLLQKHFDLRMSEAEDMIRTAKNRKTRKINTKA